tara:strand:+ start:467 stop:601 length:135 start_codon:yes stop_codon:yes gene_type:complete
VLSAPNGQNEKTIGWKTHPTEASEDSIAPDVGCAFSDEVMAVTK